MFKWNIFSLKKDSLDRLEAMGNINLRFELLKVRFSFTRILEGNFRSPRRRWHLSLNVWNDRYFSFNISNVISAAYLLDKLCLPRYICRRHLVIYSKVSRLCKITSVSLHTSSEKPYFCGINNVKCESTLTLKHRPSWASRNQRWGHVPWKRYKWMRFL